MTDFKLIHGIYESVINYALEERLSRLEENYAVTKNQLDSEESSFTLALHLTKLIANSLAGKLAPNMTKYLAVFQNEDIPQAYGISGQGLVVLDACGRNADEQR